MNGSDPKQIARELLEEAHPALIGLSHWIHANPELGYQEVLASGWVTEWLTTAGFDVRTGVGGMPTAIVGSYGPGPFHIAVCVEYDALPGIGHACGHNVIAAAGVGAGLALAAVAQELGIRVTVMGTPAEETGGGKIGLIKAGELDGVHAAMMIHPWPQDEATPTILAIRSLNVTYTGKEAHAAGFPYLGVNASDALVVAQTAIALLRQQLHSTDRVHGIVTKGGDAPNIIPARTEAHWMVRGASVARLDEVTALVRRCFEAGALATGATLEIQEEICYADVRHDLDLSRLYQSNAEQLGRVFSAAGMPVSTDMGNISYVVPTIHPMIGVAAGGAVNHQPEFAAACATPSADQAIFDGALAMAWTAIDAAQDAALRDRLMTSRSDAGEVAMVSQAWMLPPTAGAALAISPSPTDVVVVDPGAGATTDPVAALALDAGVSPAPAALMEVGAAPEAAETDMLIAAELIAGAAWASERWETTIAAPDAEAEAATQAEVPAGAEPDAEAEAVAEPARAMELTWPTADPDAEADPGAGPAWGAEPTWATASWERTVDEAPGEPVAAPEPGSEVPLDPDAAWAADVDAVAQQIAAAGFASSVTTPEDAAEPTPVEDAADEVLFVGFEDPVDPFSDVLLLDPIDDNPAAPVVAPPDADPVLDVWMTPDVLGEWVDAPEAVASAAPATAPATTAELDAPTDATVSAAAQDTIAQPTAMPLHDRDAWERAFDAAVDLPIDDREVASDVREAGEPQQVGDAPAPAWPPQASELVSREHIEAEGFSFVAPEVSSNLEDMGDVWSRNGADHATEDLRLG